MMLSLNNLFGFVISFNGKSGAKMKKERLFYLDFIRAIATIAIVMTHFNARYLFLTPQRPEKAIITTVVSNIYIGSWGVSLFFIISGAALMYVYEERCELKKFYKKRFLSIYPMFWIAYSVVFLYRFYINCSVNNGAPKINMLLSVLGFDGYLMENISTFYILGEWFLGAIILMYLLFPILRKLINDHPVLLAIVIIVMYILIIWKYNIPFNQSKFLPTRIPEILFGMYFVKYIKKINLPTAIIATAILLLNGFLKPNWNESLQTTYVGIATFILLVYISYFVKYKVIETPCNIISKYSYAIFLVHHVIIAHMMARFNLEVISILESYILFISCCVVIALFAFLLFKLHECIMKQVSQCIVK